LPHAKSWPLGVGVGGEQTPSFATETPAAAAVHGLPYVLPSQPHAGWPMSVHDAGSNAHVPLVPHEAPTSQYPADSQKSVGLQLRPPWGTALSDPPSFPEVSTGAMLPPHAVTTSDARKRQATEQRMTTERSTKRARQSTGQPPA
jgi:hypothetical protein